MVPSSVLTTKSNGDLRISGDVTFHVTGRVIGEPLTPVSIIYTQRITADQLKIDTKEIHYTNYPNNLITKSY